MTDARLIEAEAKRLGIARLCHLTPARNLLHIASGNGLRSVVELEEDREVFDQQDLDRLDQRPDHISCSIEYPNVWYLRGRKLSATPLQQLFPDWVCVLVDPCCLWRPETEFAPRNASSSGGALLRPGFDAFRGLYAERVVGAHGKTYGRARKPPACPTDDQAEVMIHKRIPLAEANTVVFADDAQARRVVSALRLLRVPVEEFEFLIAPDLFETSLSEMLRAGRTPQEASWTPVAHDAVG